MINIRFYFILLLISGFIFTSFESYSIEIDSNRSLSRYELQELQKNDDYKAIVNYQKEIKEDDAWIKKWFYKMLGYIFGNKVSLAFYRILPYIIILIAFILIVLRIANIQISSIFRKESKKMAQAGIYEKLENIGDIPLDHFLKTAINSKDYRLMIRYSYLLILKTLNEKQFIEWQKHKSNYDYLYETKSKPFGNSFASLTKYYELVWYGDFNIQAETGQKIFDDLNKFLKQIKEEEY